jgi:hypothetical protein
LGHYSPSLDTFWPSPFEQARMGHGKGGGGCMRGWRRWPGEGGRGVGARRRAGTAVAEWSRGHQRRPAEEPRPRAAEGAAPERGRRRCGVSSPCSARPPACFGDGAELPLLWQRRGSEGKGGCCARSRGRERGA